MDRWEEVLRECKVCKRLILVYIYRKVLQSSAGKRDVEEDWRRLL